MIKRLQADGWHVELIYLALSSVELSQRRVAERVAQGGHNIPAEAIIRRFPRSLHNLFYDYREQVDYCQCFMNSSEEPELVFEQQKQNCTVIHRDFYQLLLDHAS